MLKLKLKLKRFLFLLPLTIASCGPSSSSTTPTTPLAASSIPLSEVEALGDAWVGGFDEEPFMRVDFASGVARFSPPQDKPVVAPLGIIHPKIAPLSGELTFSIDDGKARRRFAFPRRKPTEDDVLEGTSTMAGGGVPRPVKLVHLASPDRKAVDAVFGGTYALDLDRDRLLFIDDGTLFDTRDGAERRLYLRSNKRAMIGSAVDMSFPSPGDLTFDQTGKTLRYGEVTATRMDVTQHEIRFPSSDGQATLAGTLLLPRLAKENKPVPVVINVHGSGRVTRHDHWGNMIARVFLSIGVGVFLYDKRGVGDSTGEYVGRGARDTNNVSQENLDRLAGDAAQAAATLAKRPDVDAKQIGLTGLSQAGWIVPIAAKKSDGLVRFILLMSGPTVQTSIELAYSALVGDAESCLPIDQADRVASDHAPRIGFDPIPTIDALDIPAHWIFGALDSSIPVPASVRALDTINSRHRRTFSTLIIPDAGHELYQISPRDTEDARLHSKGLSPRLITSLRTFMADHSSLSVKGLRR